MSSNKKHTGAVTCDNCGRKLRKIANLYKDGFPAGLTFVMEDKTTLTFCRFCLADLGKDEFVPMSDKVKAIWKEEKDHDENNK